MKPMEKAVAQHYGDDNLLERILTGLKEAGVDINNLQADDLAPVDEFHIGGRKATVHAVEKMSLKKDQHILDVGCAIGGGARYIASEIGCRVTGIDLTPEYISIAKTLTGLTGLSDQVTFEVASALEMPFERESFDGAITIHVAMNIRDRETLYKEIARVMKSGATLCIYDLMKKNDEDLTFPLPWAETPETSHLTTPDEMKTLLGDAGFEIGEVEDRTEPAIDFFKQSFAASSDGPPPLGPHIVIGASASEKFKNVLDNIEKGRIAPVVMMAVKT